VTGLGGGGDDNKIRMNESIFTLFLAGRQAIRMSSGMVT
jgi:hypothetical protein